ncbi:RNA-directed DNA polymerase, partial [Billgrantia azerbaijanica]
ELVAVTPLPVHTFQYLQPCIDYCALNAITIKGCYPIPLILEHLNHLSMAKIFTKLDLKGAYNLLCIAHGHKWKTVFCTWYSSFEYLVMPFGLCNARSTFQQLMNYVLADILDSTIIIYLDDILVFCDTPVVLEYTVIHIFDFGTIG